MTVSSPPRGRRIPELLLPCSFRRVDIIIIIRPGPPYELGYIILEAAAPPGSVDLSGASRESSICLQIDRVIEVTIPSESLPLLRFSNNV